MAKLPPSDPNGLRKIQVGCGPHNIFPDWWNVDIRSFEGIDEVMDVTQQWPYTDTLDYVFGEHFIEHLSIDKTFEFLCQVNHALQVGGKVRLSTPSLEWVLSTHYSLTCTDLEQTLSQTFQINRAFYGWGHQFLYSRAMLTRLVEAAGFTDLSYWGYGESIDPNLKNLERHGGYQVVHGYPSVWIIEASKSNRMTTQVDLLFIKRIRENFLAHVASGH